MWFTCSKTNYIWWCLYNKTRRSIMINTILNINLRPEWILHHFYKFFATVTKAYSSILFIVSNYCMQSLAVFQNILEFCTVLPKFCPEYFAFFDISLSLFWKIVPMLLFSRIGPGHCQCKGLHNLIDSLKVFRKDPFFNSVSK